MGGVDLMGGFSVPRRLGGGYLFWSHEALYRSKSFTGPLEAVTALPTNAIGVAFGHDSILLFTPETPPRAFALDSPRALPLSPPGAVDIAGADDARVVALDAVGRPLASIDGGQHWEDVSPQLAGRAHGVLEAQARVGFSLDASRAAWLAPDGHFEIEPFESWKPEPLPAETDLERLERTVRTGVALSKRTALVGDGNGVRVVDLETARADAVRPLASPGMNCVPLSAESEGLVTCTSYTAQGSSRVVISHALSGAPRTEKIFPRADIACFSAQGRVLLEATCTGAFVEGVACVRSPAGRWREIDARPLLAGRTVLSWVLGDRDAVGALGIDPRRGTLALLNPEKRSVTTWDKAASELGEIPRGAGARVTNLRLLADGSVRGLLSKGALRVSATGVVQLPEPRFEVLAASGERALGRDAEGRLFQTTNDGAEWRQVEPPPETIEPRPASEDGAPEPLRVSNGPQMQCTALGCAIAHSAGAGSWLRMFWPMTPAGPVRQAATESVLSPPPPPPLVEVTRPHLTCRRAGSSVPNESAKTRRSGTSPSERELEYYDTFHEPDALPRVNGPLRAVLRIEGSGKGARSSLADSLSASTRVSVRYREPFEPKGVERRSSDSFAHWFPNPEDIDAHQGSARPVLSPRAGASDGLLLRLGASASWLSNGHAVALPSQCNAQSAYVDDKNKLLLSCASRNGATRIEDVSGKAVFAWYPSVFARDKRRSSMSYFAPGERSFDTPDVIAIAPDGKLALIRLSSGSRPATADNPAWLLSEGGAVALAPWSTLELANSAACAQQPNGYRALIQTTTAWLSLDADASAPDAPANMWAIVRWSPERVCLEAVELGSTERPERVIARFVGKSAEAALFNPRTRWAKAEAASCTFTKAE
jgi:hypothetical protein